MAVYKIFPTKDATIYSLYPDKNTGRDEIIEVSLDVNGVSNPDPQTSRFLIQFSTDEILDVINNKISGAQWQSNLRCFIADVSGLNQTTVLDIYPISQSWNMGTGKLVFNPEVTDGVSWRYRSYYVNNPWTTGTFSPNTTGSYSSSSIGGGTWYTNLYSSQSFEFYSSKDINSDVTSIVSAWSESIIENNGFIIKQRDEFVNSIYVQPKLKYFSIDTHTIYPPCLEFKWNDCVINTGSSGITNLNTQPATITLGENAGTYYPNSINRFRVYSRPEYPARVFSTSSYYTQNYYLPDESYYAIQDLYTNEYVIDFDDVYTKLSKDTESSYFTLYMNGLEPERYYKVLIKTILDGNTLVFDNNYYFKVING